MKHKKILFIYANYSGFVKTDNEILSSEFDVTQYHFIPSTGMFAIFLQLFRQFVFLLFNIRSFDVVYIWFADLHSFLPVLLAKLTCRKCFLVIGGYDVCRIPSLHYGVFCSKLRGFAAVYSMKNSTLNLPVSNYVARKVKAITRKDNFKTIYNCVNIKIPDPIIKIARTLVLTVGQIDTERSFLLKGIDTFVEVARLLPGIPFCIAGFDQKKLAHLQRNFPGNIEVLGNIGHDQLPNLYLHTKIYCQLSRSESFGVALAEAIYLGCFPVVTNEGGMPEVVKNKEYIVKRESLLISEKIKNLFINSETIEPGKQKKGIWNDFPYEKRAKIIINEILSAE